MLKGKTLRRHASSTPSSRLLLATDPLMQSVSAVQSGGAVQPGHLQTPDRGCKESGVPSTYVLHLPNNFAVSTSPDGTHLCMSLARQQFATATPLCSSIGADWHDVLTSRASPLSSLLHH